MKKQTTKKETTSKVSTKNYEVDMDALTVQMLKNDVKNWIISEGATKIIKGETPGPNMITLLTMMKIIK